MMKVFKKDHCQLTYKPGSQDAITTKNEMIYNLLYLYVLRLKIRLDRHLFLLVRCLVVNASVGSMTIKFQILKQDVNYMNEKLLKSRCYKSK